METDKKRKFLKLLLIFTFIAFPLGHILRLITPFNFSLLDLTVFIFISVYFGLFRKFSADKAVLKNPIFVFIISSLILLLINSFRIPKKEIFVGLFYWMRFVIYFIFYLQLTSVNFSKKIIEKGLLLIGFFLGFFGIIQYVFYPDLRNLLYLGWDPHYFRVFSSLFDPNFTGIILVLTVFQFIFSADKVKGNLKFIYYPAFLIIVISLILTHSRSVYLALLTGFVVFFLSLRKIKQELIIGIILAIILFVLIPKPHLDVFNLLRRPTAIARINNLGFTWKSIIKFPLIGKGFGTITYTDSSFLYVLATTGLIGLIIFAWIWIRIITFGVFKDRRILVIASVLFISSWFNNTLFYPWVLFWFYLFMVYLQES